nr:hypothetical protein MACL_00002311 [Theileria orientalis]
MKRGRKHPTKTLCGPYNSQRSGLRKVHLIHTHEESRYGCFKPYKTGKIVTKADRRISFSRIDRTPSLQHKSHRGIRSTAVK